MKRAGCRSDERRHCPDPGHLATNDTEIVDLLWRWLARLYPLFVLALAVGQILKHASPTLFGDEWRYLWYATHLTHGYFSPADNP